MKNGTDDKNDSNQQKPLVRDDNVDIYVGRLVQLTVDGGELFKFHTLASDDELDSLNATTSTVSFKVWDSEKDSLKVITSQESLEIDVSPPENSLNVKVGDVKVSEATVAMRSETNLTIPRKKVNVKYDNADVCSIYVAASDNEEENVSISPDHNVSHAAFGEFVQSRIVVPIDSRHHVVKTNMLEVVGGIDSTYVERAQDG